MHLFSQEPGYLFKNFFDYIEGGEDLSEFLDDFPSASKEAALAVLEIAKKSFTSEKVLHEILLDESLPRKLKNDFGADHKFLRFVSKAGLGKRMVNCLH